MSAFSSLFPLRMSQPVTKFAFSLCVFEGQYANYIFASHIEKKIGPSVCILSVVRGHNHYRG